MAIDLLPLPLTPGLPPVPDDPEKQTAWLKDLRERYEDLHGIIKRNFQTLATPVRRAPVEDDPEIGYALARNTIKDAALVLGMNRMQMGLQLADGADRGKVNVSFKYLGVGPLVLGSGATATYTADLAVAGVNGLDTGSEAGDTWYYVYVISGDHGPDLNDPTANNEQPPLRRHAAPVATLLSTSATPLLPGGYNRYRRVGMVRNNASSDLYRFTNAADDDWFWWNEDVNATPFLVLNVTTSVGAFTTADTRNDVDCSAVAPPTSRELMINAFSNDGAILALWVRNNDSANVAAGTASRTISGPVSSAPVQRFECGCDSSQIVEYATLATTSDVRMTILAYRDIR